jgi:leucyl-tRNA synthetase
LRQLWDYSQARFAFDPAATERSGEMNGAPSDGEPVMAMGPEKTEHLRKRLEQWCATAVEKITEDASELEMHSAVRNVMRLFDRIRDYEKRVLAKRGELCEEDREALVEALRLLARVLTPFAPHIAEELLIASRLSDTDEIDTTWPASELVPR